MQFKYSDQLSLAPFFARLMVGVSADVLERADLLIPVPIHWTRLIKRRYNQAAILAYYMNKITSIPFKTDVLLRWKATKVQKSSFTFRQNNVRNAFSIKTKKEHCIMGKKILLIDDVFTTGATVNECAKTLKKHGAQEVHVLTIAKTKYDY